MILNNDYIVHPTATFKGELKQITHYTKYKLKEPSLAINFYKKIIQEINSLKFMPERFPIIYQLEGFIYRNLLIDNYVIIYQVNKDTGQVFILHIFHGSQNYLHLL